jgi:ABC-type antimicrobial peptide transport system permease subunit
MLRNYLIIAWRNLKRHKIFSLINVLGLSMGLACSLLIWLWVADERSYDQFHTNGEQLHMIFSDYRFSNGETKVDSYTPAPLAPLLQQEVPEVENALRLMTADGWEDYPFVRYGEKVFKQRAYYADASLFTMFSFPLKAGNPREIFKNPYSVALSHSVVQKLFGSENPLGKTVTIQFLEGVQDFQVTGVFADVPRQSSMQFDLVIPYETFQERNDWMKQWGNHSIKTFVQLRPDASVPQVNTKIKDFVRKRYQECNYDLLLQPYQSLYLQADLNQKNQTTGRIAYVWLFSVIALFILGIACINFMNLSTARATSRAREVGIRKVAGASRLDLIRQFLGESMLMAGLGMILALSLVQVLLPMFGRLTGKVLSLPLENSGFVLCLVEITVGTGLLAGSYPALFLSTFQPTHVLKGFWLGNRALGKGNRTVRGVFIRQSLVTFQFILATILPIGTIVIYQQIQYLKNRKLGLDRENVIYFPLNQEFAAHREAFRNELVNLESVQSFTFSSANPLDMRITSSDPVWSGKTSGDDTDFIYATVDYHFLRTMGITLEAGRDFSSAFASDSINYIINEEAARRMHMRNPIGQNLRFWRGQGKIIGLMQDFHHRSMHTPIAPMVLMLWPSDTYIGLVRIKPGHTAQALADLKTAFQKFCPSVPLEYHFLDETFEHQYKSETLTEHLAFTFTALSIFISCLGLLGLSIFSATQRTKEIGIRKVLGANVSNILLLLSRDLIKLVLMANLIAWPLAWWGIHHWLNNYAYRIDIQPWLFVLPTLLVLLIALLTVMSILINNANF